MKQKHIWLVVAVAALAGLLFFASKVAQPKLTYWEDTDIACLPNGHADLALHIHPLLKVTVNDVDIPIAGGIGVSQTCLAEVHTHEEGGTIHIESTSAGKEFTIADFYAVSGDTLEQTGFTLTVKVNGEVHDDIATYLLKDGDKVELTYTGIPQ